MKNWILVVSILLNVGLLAALYWVNERYGLWGKFQRVAIEEGRVPGLAAQHELNRNYQARRAMFQLDRNKDAKALFIGDSQVSLADWNAMLGAPLVANRGIEGDTTAGVLARLSDDQEFSGDSVILWIGTNDVLQGEGAEGIAARISAAAKELGDRRGEIEGRSWEMGERRLEIGNGEDGGGKAESGNAEKRNEDRGDRRLQIGAGAQRRQPEAKPRANGRWESSESETAPRQKLTVIVLGVVPVAGWVERAAERNLVVAEVNERLTAAAQDGGFVFVDLDPVLSDGLGYLRGDMTSDGVHLGARGYAEIVEKLKAEILKN